VHHRIEYDEATETIVVETFGDASLAGFDAMRAEILGHPGFAKRRRVLIDHTGIDTTAFSEEDVRELAVRARAPGYAGSRLALVTPSTSVFGRSRQYEAYLDAEDLYELHVFRDRPAAFAWLTRP